MSESGYSDRPKRRDTGLYSDHVTGRGRDLFAAIAGNDLEGIVAKLAAAPYALIDGRSPFIKIKHAHYSQAVPVRVLWTVSRPSHAACIFARTSRGVQWS